MSAFSACPPVQNTSAEGLQDQGAPPMRSANENPPPTPSPLSADELNRWSSPPPPPLERCAPTADEFQGVSPMAEVGGGTGMLSSVHIFHNMGAMAHGTFNTRTCISSFTSFLLSTILPECCEPNECVSTRTIRIFWRTRLLFSTNLSAFSGLLWISGCPGYCVQGSMPQVNQGQFCQKPVWQPLPQQNKFFPY